MLADRQSRIGGILGGGTRSYPRLKYRLNAFNRQPSQSLNEFFS